MEETGPQFPQFWLRDLRASGAAGDRPGLFLSGCWGHPVWDTVFSSGPAPRLPLLGTECANAHGSLARAPPDSESAWNPQPAFLQRPRLGLFTTQTYNLHILMPPVISPSERELRCHKTREAWQSDLHLYPPPQAPALPEVPCAATNNRVEGGQE